MEKEKILQRYRQEGVDEGREEVNRRGDDAGFYAMCVLALLLLCKQAAKIFQTICKKETALKRVLRNLLSAISFAQI